MFINLETDPCILHSPPCRICVNLPPPITFRLLLTSALGRYSDSRSRPHSDSTWSSALVVLSIRLYPPLRNTCLPHCNPVLMYTDPTRSSVSIHATSSRNSTWTSVSRFSIRLTSLIPHLRTPFGPPSPSTLFLYLQVQTIQLCSDVRSHLCLISSYKFEPTPLDLCPCPRYNPNPCHPTPLRHPCLTPSYKFKPMPLGPVQTPSLSVLRVPHGSEPLITTMETVHLLFIYIKGILFKYKIGYNCAHFICVIILASQL
jgi:hypothetical protein